MIKKFLLSVKSPENRSSSIISPTTTTKEKIRKDNETNPIKQEFPVKETSLNPCDDWNIKYSICLHQIEKSSKTKDFLLTILKQNLFLSTYLISELRIIVDAFEGIRLTIGQCVYAEGCDSNYIYIMQTGKLSIFAKEVTTQQSIQIAQEMKIGQIFGDSEFIKIEMQSVRGVNESFSNGKSQYSVPTRLQTIKATEDCLLWRIPGLIFLDLITHKLSIESLEKRTFMHSLTILKYKIRDKFTQSTFSDFFRSLSQIEYSSGDVIATSGQVVEYVHIIYKGIVSIDSSSRRLGCGECIGDDCIIDNKSYTHTYYALESHVTCLLLPKHLFLLYFFNIDSSRYPVVGSVNIPSSSSQLQCDEFQGSGRISQISSISATSYPSYLSASTSVAASASAADPVSRLNSVDLYESTTTSTTANHPNISSYSKSNNSSSHGDSIRKEARDSSTLLPTDDINSELRESFTSNLSSSRSLTNTSNRSLKSILASPRPSHPPAPETDANPKTKKKVAIKIESLSLGDSLRKALQFSSYKRTSPMKTIIPTPTSNAPTAGTNISGNQSYLSMSPVRSLGLTDSPARDSIPSRDDSQTLNGSMDDLDSPSQGDKDSSRPGSYHTNTVSNVMRTSREALLTGGTDTSGWMTGRSTTSYMNTARSSIDNSDYRSLGARSIAFLESSAVESSRIKQLQDHRRSVGPVSRMTSPRMSLTPGAGGSNLMSAEYMAAFQNMTLDDCELMQVIGVGGFGRVRLAKVKATNQIIVLKTQSKKAIMESHMESVIINEIQLMREMKHPYIARLYCAFQDNTSIHMAMELLQGGDFFALLKREIKFSEEKCIFYSATIVLALEALHSVKIAYRDLKPENLVLNHRGFLKLVDFGLAKRIKNNGKTWTLCGTTDYMAPEILNDKGHSCPVDWWALGALLYEMIDGFPPFYHENQMKVYHKILHAQPKFSEGFNTYAADLITKLLIKNPVDRLCYKASDGVSEIQKHPWFRNINWKSLMRGTVRPPYKPTLSGCTDTTYFEECASTKEEEQYEEVDWEANLDLTLMERRRAELAQLSQVWTNALVAQQNVGQDRGPIHPFTPARLGGLGLGLGLGLTDISRSSFVVDDMALTSARQSMGTRSDLYLQELGVSPYNSRIRQVPSVVIGNINPSVSIGSPLKPMAALSTKQMGISKGSSPTSPSSPDQTGVENVNDLNLPASSRFNIEAICDSTHDMKLNGHDFTSASATGINTIDTMSSGIYGFKTPGAGNRNSSDLKSTSSGKNGPTNVPRSSDSGNDKTTATATATTGTLYDSDVDDPFGPPVERFHAPMLNRNMRRWSTSTIDSPMIAAMMEDSIADVRMAIQPLQTYRRASLASPPSAKIPMSSSKASPGATILPISPGNPSDAIQALSNDNRDGPQSIEFGLDGCRLEKE